MDKNLIVMHIYTITSSSHIKTNKLWELVAEQQSGQDVNSTGHTMTLEGHGIKMSLCYTSTPSQRFSLSK